MEHLIFHLQVLSSICWICCAMLSLNSMERFGCWDFGDQMPSVNTWKTIWKYDPKKMSFRVKACKCPQQKWFIRFLVGGILINRRLPMLLAGGTTQYIHMLYHVMLYNYIIIYINSVRLISWGFSEHPLCRGRVPRCDLSDFANEESPIEQ